VKPRLENWRNISMKDNLLTIRLSASARERLLADLNYYKKWNEVKRFVSLGGPLQGTLTAWFIVLFGKGRAMLPGSTFFKKLHSYPVPHGKMITISAQVDELVPKKNNTITGAKSYVVTAWGHNRIHLGSRTTYDLIARLAAMR